jgi:hypothetical protein
MSSISCILDMYLRLKKTDRSIDQQMTFSVQKDEKTGIDIFDSTHIGISVSKKKSIEMLIKFTGVKLHAMVGS